MKSIKTILLIAGAISFITVIGGAVYEHLSVVPRWKLAPPASLTMMQGKYGLNAGKFWMLIHPVTVLLLIAALIANWKTARRKYILMPLMGYALVLILTIAWFVPELMAIVRTPYQPVTDAGLVSRADLWEKLSIARLIFILPIAGILLFSLTKGNDNANLAIS